MSLESLNVILASVSVVNETALVMALLFVSLMLLSLWRLSAGFAPGLRPIAAYAAAASAVEYAVESGRPVHVSPGAGGVGEAMTAQTLAGLDLTVILAQMAATSGARLLVSTASPLLLPMVDGVQREAHTAAGYPQDYKTDQTRFLSDNRNAYALGVGTLARREGVVLNVLAGDLADEYLLAAEPVAMAGTEQIAGTGNPRTLPFVVSTADHPLIGEELFVAGAYLSRRSSLASLLAQDQMRLLLVGLVLVGVILESLGAG